jgi:hypothetical protein
MACILASRRQDTDEEKRQKRERRQALHVQGVFVFGGGAAGRDLKGAFRRREGPTGLWRISDKDRDVTIKSVARTTVTLLKNEDAPRAPKRDWLDPPIMTPVSAPFPDWRRTAITIRMQVRT